jgi:quercetin dioxygenase-like cupin family protein
MNEELNSPPKFSFIYDGTQVNIYHANKGQGLAKHQHEYAHATICCNGSLLVKKENLQLIADKNTQPINLIAGEWHELEATEDETVFINIFSVGKGN